MAGFASGQDEGNIVILIIYPKKNTEAYLARSTKDGYWLRSILQFY